MELRFPEEGSPPSQPISNLPRPQKIFISLFLFLAFFHGFFSTAPQIKLKNNSFSSKINLNNKLNASLTSSVQTNIFGVQIVHNNPQLLHIYVTVQFLTLTLKKYFYFCLLHQRFKPKTKLCFSMQIFQYQSSTESHSALKFMFFLPKLKR